MSDQEIQSEIVFLRGKLSELQSQKKRSPALTTIIPLIIALVSVLASAFQSSQSSRLKLEEIRLEERQIDNAFDPRIIDGLLNPDTQKNAIALGNGLYLYQKNNNSARWWCGIIKEIDPNNKLCKIYWQ